MDGLTAEELPNEQIVQELTRIYRQAGIRWDQFRGVVNGMVVCMRNSEFDAVTQPLLVAVGRKAIQEKDEERREALDRKRRDISRIARPMPHKTYSTGAGRQKQRRGTEPTKADK
jgi:hypothetical protein